MGNFLCILQVVFTSAKFLANSQMTDMFTSGLQSHTSITFSNSIELIVFPDAWQLVAKTIFRSLPYIPLGLVFRLSQSSVKSSYSAKSRYYAFFCIPQIFRKFQLAKIISLWPGIICLFKVMINDRTFFSSDHLENIT